ncbi:MAG: hypothetical protein ABUL64_00510 [Singulisphaera sp.]
MTSAYDGPRGLTMPARFTLIICEQSQNWVVPLRLALARSVVASGAGGTCSPLVAGSDYRLVETRSAEDCLAALTDEPRAVVGVELTSTNCDAALALVRTMAERFAAARSVVLAARELAEFEWLARELGAAGYVISPRQLDEFLLIARRHWASLPRPELGAAESAWATLPWK